MKIELDGLTTHYQRIGEGQPLILLHGWGCSWEVWQPIIQPLAADYELILPDLPNFGQTDQTNEIWDSHDYGQWLKTFIKKMDVSAFFLGGHSLGGKIAAHYAADETNQLQPDKLVLIDSAGLPTPLPWYQRLQKKTLKAVPIPIKELVPTRVKHKLLKWTHSSTDHFFADEHQKKILEKVVEEDISHLLPKIKIPTLLLWGRYDLATPLKDGQEFNRLIPESLMVVFDHAQHFPFVDEPDKFVEVIQAQL